MSVKRFVMAAQMTIYQLQSLGWTAARSITKDELVLELPEHLAHVYFVEFDLLHWLGGSV